MLYWDRKFLTKLREINVVVKGYKRFKDDTSIMLNPVDRKLKYEKGNMVLKNEEELERESKLENDEVSMKTIKEVADSLEEMIETEIDFPSNS